MKGYLCLENGPTFEGVASGDWTSPIQGEIVFFTGMTGYQEVLTDPSYKGQIIVFTYPLIGNYGINETDGESPRIQVSGVVMFQCTEHPSHYKATSSLSQFLNAQGVPFLTAVDTREVTKAIRSEGTKQAVLARKPSEPMKKPEQDQVFEVKGEGTHTYGSGRFHIVLIDFGWKKSILTSLLKRDCRVTVIAFTDIGELGDLNPDGVVLSNGPGDPKDAGKYLTQLKNVIDHIPVFGICMGHQMIALAYGANTKKLTFGHRGANHPVKDTKTDQVFLTSQNHSYVVDEDSLAATPLFKRFYNVNDGSVEGLMHKSKPVMSVQFHPEAHPGPADADGLFDEYLEWVYARKGEKVYV